ncbi:hypothetical protein BO99DRAFT_403082 [Aspergillus violaceofuscus CBS 115571]|uniref:Uncharacterized protein n=1 Tax=Aspergillus violaceofuscus (strain CBS 115571) TaxID=1450538 RepID=A0A2V5H9F9_ASPV1|nr:hypothetical protein BO99DRAFT_403082 [Aspergillus violaceofuscus CBS 115571]
MPTIVFPVLAILVPSDHRAISPTVEHVIRTLNHLAILIEETTAVFHTVLELFQAGIRIFGFAGGQNRYSLQEVTSMLVFVVKRWTKLLFSNFFR